MESEGKREIERQERDREKKEREFIRDFVFVYD